MDAANEAVTAIPTAGPHTLYKPTQRWLYLGVLFLVAMSNHIDRNIISVLLEPIKNEFGASDTQLGLLSGLAFALFYATLGIPVARWADRGNRRHIMTLALAIWSVMTALCGVAGNFWQLALARVGVGAGEAGAVPPAQSLIADYFAPKQRATALAVFTASATAGYLVAFIVGSHLVTNYGWRTAFIAVGTPGLLLALLTHFILKEPREVLGFRSSASSSKRFGTVLRELFAKRSYCFIVAGITLYMFIAYGAVVFFPSFMVRSLGVSMAEVGTAFGLVAAGSALTGTLGGGFLADRLVRRDIRWLAWLPALGCALAMPLYLGAFLTGSFSAFLACCFAAGALLSAGLPSVFAALHAVCGSSRRALAVAMLLFLGSLIGSGLGPLATGALSDFLSSRFGPEALRYSLMSVMAILLPSALCLYLAGNLMPADLES